MDHVETFLHNHPNLRPFADLVVYPPTVDEATDEFPLLASDPQLLERGYEYIVFDGKCGVTRLAHYTICRRKGQSHSMAAMFALQSSPRVNTNDTFWAGRPKFWQVFGTGYADDVRAKLAKQGIKLGENAEYLPELARFRGDPEAVVPSHAVRDHIKKVCEQRGWTCEGSVTAKGRGPESDPLAIENCVPLAEDIIRSNANRMVRENPDLARKSKRELRELVLEKHGPSK